MKKPVSLHLDRSPGAWRAVRLVGGSVDAVWVELDETPSIVDRFFLARVEEYVPAANAAVVNLGADGQAFLPALHAPGTARERKNIRTAVTLGAHILVQGNAEAGGSDKLPRVTARPAFQLFGQAFRPHAATPQDAGAAPAQVLARWQEIEKAAAARTTPGEIAPLGVPFRIALWASRIRPLEKIVVNEPELVASLKADLPALTGQSPAVEKAAARWATLDREAAWAEVEQLAAERHPLTGGGFLSLERTRAFLAVDVDGGAARTPLPTLNETALRRLAALVRLRRESGLIVVDPAGDQPHRTLANLVRDAAPWFDDPELECQIGGPTRFGLIELRRQRRHRSLGESLAEPAAHRAGALRAWLRAIEDTRETPEIELSEDLFSAMETPAGAAACEEAARWAGQSPVIRAISGLPARTWRLA